MPEAQTATSSAEPAGRPRTDAGQAMWQLAAELCPICRSITGNGLRETLRRLLRQVPLGLHEVPSGAPVFDWSVPKEWNISDAFVKDARLIRYPSENTTHSEAPCAHED
jgi:aminopeptidase-like protein